MTPIAHLAPPASDLLYRDTRCDTIMGAPEARSRRLIAFALLLRLDLSPEHAVLFLREAPTMRTPAEIWAWVENIPQQSERATLH